MPSIRQIIATDPPVASSTRRSSANSCYFLPRHPQDLHLHRLPAHQPLQLLDARLGRPQLAHRHHLAVRAYRRLGPLGGQVLPLLDQRPANPRFAAQLGGRHFPLQQPIDLLPVELRREQPATIGTTGD